MEKEEKLNIALQKLKQLLSLAPETDKEKVRLELCKMIPENKDASVYPKIGWGHYNDLIQTGTSFKVVPCYSTNEKISLFELYSNLMQIYDYDLTDKFIEAFDIILSQKPKSINMGVLPATKIDKKTTACRINFKIILNEQKKM